MRKTKIIGFSVPPEIYHKLEQVIRKKHKTKSEFFREMIEVYFQNSNPSAKPQATTKNNRLRIKEENLATILKAYWELKSKTATKTIIIGLGIITNSQGKVLIGARKNKDPWVKNLTWVFPGGKIESLDFEKEVAREVKEETGLTVVARNLIAARVHPDSGFKPVQIVALYFHCESLSRKRPKPSGDLAKLKWVKPTEVFKYFTTSTCDEVTKFLVTIEKAKI